jgi:pyrroloquinoline quinone biosynthesis protein D
MKFVLAPGFRLQYEPTQEATVLLYPEGMVVLNTPASAVLSCCNEPISEEDLIAEIRTAFDDTEDEGRLAADVHQFLETACAQGWLIAC